MMQHPSEAEWREHLTSRQQMRQQLDALIAAGQNVGEKLVKMEESIADLSSRIPTKEQVDYLAKETESRAHWAWVGRNVVRYGGGLVAFGAAVVGLHHFAEVIRHYVDSKP